MFLFGFIYDCEVGQQFSLKMGTFRIASVFPTPNPYGQVIFLRGQKAVMRRKEESHEEAEWI